ncbi:hypothetical protein BWQ96_05141 [Gracilariopsis chorda]|uniref:Uncharacterized protein n=1 Tax=Gracilariopsis chorda TaxID=448386 RepID=A0A2V3ISM0_9FLOR|nr:hypothetical protein BWQ96_05141 [Gracilariopsis chorda]|eukprot:PXF45102.1 hypothetical protein BWQ96_05141 [Gracilariopsis chorda]
MFIPLDFRVAAVLVYIHSLCLRKLPVPEEAVRYEKAIIGEDPDNVPEEDLVELVRSIVASVMDVSPDPHVENWSPFDSKYQELSWYMKARVVVLKR